MDFGHVETDPYHVEADLRETKRTLTMLKQTFAKQNGPLGKIRGQDRNEEVSQGNKISRDGSRAFGEVQNIPESSKRFTGHPKIVAPLAKNYLREKIRPSYREKIF